MSRNDIMRGGFRVSTNDYEYDRGDMPSWLQNFANNAEKYTAVEEARSRTAAVADEIASIMNGTAKFSTVEDAVKYYQERTGLVQYLKANAETNKKATAALEEAIKELGDKANDEPKVFEKSPSIRDFVENKIRSAHGLTHIPAIQDEVLNVYKLEGVTQDDINDPIFMKFINDIITREQEDGGHVDSANIGKGVGVDPLEDGSAEDDAFGFASPQKS